MYNKVPGGRMEEIQGIKCHLPPVGYGVNRLTGELEHIGVYKRSVKKSEQYWERLPLPVWYEDRREIEEARQIEDKDYTDNELEDIRSMHWQYRLCGFWFMNNGVATYITGLNWLYLNWCATSEGYLNYRDNDRKLFYIISNADHNPYCGGIVYVGRRQCGKTYIACAWMLDRMTTISRKMGGIQSKTDTDAKKVFNKIVNYFFEFPHFFQPTYDTSKGLRPESDLKFFKTTIRGKKAGQLKKGDELKSWIEPGNSKSVYYDGTENMACYILDEFAKPQLTDTWETWKVVKPCIFKEGRWFGKAFVCSTIEDMDVTGEASKHIWNNSNQAELNKNGFSESGLYRIFFGAHETTFYDQYGNPDINRGYEFHNNEREVLKNKPRDLSSYIRKNPYTILEAFRIDGEKCIYDSMKLNDRLDALAPFENLRERGNFVWKNGEVDGKVVWEKNKNGRFEKCWDFSQPEMSNRMLKRGNLFYPNNTVNFVAACDPFSHSKTQDNNRRSMAAACFKRKFDPANEEDPYNDAIICIYHGRPDDVNIFHEDMIKACVYYGCEILFESNKNNWEAYFIARGYEGFLMKLPGNNGYGVPGNDPSAQRLCDLTELQISQNINKQHFPKILSQWLEFEFGNRTPYDLAMAAGYVFIADDRWSVREVKSQTVKITRLFKKHKIQKTA
jgi:hypothetical protein